MGVTKSDKNFSTVLFARGSIPHTEELPVVSGTVRKGQQLFDRRVKEWSNNDCCYVSWWLVNRAS